MQSTSRILNYEADQWVSTVSPGNLCAHCALCPISIYKWSIQRTSRILIYEVDQWVSTVTPGNLCAHCALRALFALCCALLERRWSSSRNLDYWQKRSMVCLWFTELHGETTKDKPGLICPKIQESPYPV